MTYTIIDTLEAASSASPALAAIVDNTGSITFEALHADAGRFAAWLKTVGLARGERVGICLPKCREEIVAILGVAAARGVFVNLNYQWAARQIAFVQQDCDIRFLVTDMRRLAQMREAGVADNFERVIVLGEAPNEQADEWTSLETLTPMYETPLGADIAALLYTSGSTGNPKGVVLDHGMLLRGAKIVSDYLGITSQDRILSVPPFSFDYGLNQLTSALHCHATLALQRVAMPSAIAGSVGEWDISGLPLVAPSWIQLIDYLEDADETLPGLRYVTNTGGAIPGSTLEKMQDRLPEADIVLMYGLTEAFRSTFLPPHLFTEKMGSIGRAIPNVEIFVVDEEKGICGPGETGELVHRGDLISHGYWNRPEETAKRIRVNPYLVPLIGEEKVLHSGDKVRLDEDGILWFVGRDDDMIKTSGHRVSPTEIESATTDLDTVTAAVAFGIPDSELGQVVVLVFECEQEAASLEIGAFLRQTLPTYMQPRVIYPWPGLMPRTGNGKIDRQVVKREAGKHISGSTSEE